MRKCANSPSNRSTFPIMKLLLTLFLTWLCGSVALPAAVTAGRYDMASVRDASTLETRVVEEWHPWAKDTSVRQKLVEITVCEWWPGQKVRLQVTLIAPSTGGPCRDVIVGNAGVELKA